MSTMKLQKLVYYSQAWHLAWREQPLFDETIEAWANGPVVYELFAQHRGQFTVDEWPLGDSSRLTGDQRDTIDRVISAYGSMSGRRLSALTHAERPWIDARAGFSSTQRSNTPIATDAMQEYYSALDADSAAVRVSSLSDATPQH